MKVSLAISGTNHEHIILNGGISEKYSCFPNNIIDINCISNPIGSTKQEIFSDCITRQYGCCEDNIMSLIDINRINC
jgi:hypothetical protein